MLNRFWTSAALAAIFAIFAFCSVSGGQEKKTGGKAPELAPAVKKSTEQRKGLSKGLSAKLTEMTRDVEPSPGSGITDAPSLFKAIEDMGFEFDDNKPQDFRWVNVGGTYVFTGLSDNKAWVIFQCRFPLKEPASIPSERLLNLMEFNTPDTGTWIYVSENTSLLALGAIPTKSANRVAIRKQLEGVANLIKTGVPIFRNAIAQ
jgi:hypothetical protein